MKSTEMKQHAGSQRGEIRQPAGTVPEALNHRVDSLRRLIGDWMRHKASDAPQMMFDGFRRLDHRAESCVCHSPGPVMCKPHRSRYTPVAPDAPEVLLERPCFGRPQILPQQPAEVPRFLPSEVRVRSEPLILRSLEGIISGVAQSCMLLTPHRFDRLVEVAGHMECIEDNDRLRQHRLPCGNTGDAHVHGHGLHGPADRRRQHRLQRSGCFLGAPFAVQKVCPVVCVREQLGHSLRTQARLDAASLGAGPVLLDIQ